MSSSSRSPTAIAAPRDEHPFRQLVSNLFLKNDFSGAMVQRVCASAAQAGAKEVNDLGRAGHSGARMGNAPRDLLRTILKDKKGMPALYMALIPLHNTTTEEIEETMFPFILPHEVLAKIIAKKPLCELKGGLEPELKNELGKSCGDLGLDADQVLPLGLHGDGVPHQKQGTTECFSWNIASLPHMERILAAVVDKRGCCKCGCGGRHTTDRILEVLCWSFRCLVAGKYPDTRHDGTPWNDSDKTRAKLTGDIGARGMLCQVRGDWSWYKQMFNFPSWSSASICWRCKANNTDLPWTDCTASAKWRQNRLTDKSFFNQMRLDGIEPCPLFKLPGFRLAFVGIDVLHCCDLGITQDLIGNVLWEFLTGGFLAGRNIGERTKELGLRLKEHYKAMQTPVKIDRLTTEMVKQDRKGPKLRAKGAETKGVLPFAMAISLEMAKSKPTTHYKTIAAATSSLMDFYVLLDNDEWQPAAASEASRRYCVLYAALSTRSADIRFWKMKPKMHMFQELVEFQALDLGHPARFWTYQDESFVGEVAKLAFSRGGPRHVASAAVRTLDRYRALSQL